VQVDAPVGLSAAEAARRLASVGRNEIARRAATPAWRILARQFASPLIWLLLGASVLAGVLGEVVDAVAIGAILVLNALVGFFQEHRAEAAMLALQAMTAPRARVVRDGRTVELAAAEIVPGDLLVMEAGDIVAADARILEANALSANEAALTGESVPSEKSAKPVPDDAPLAERHDTLFMGTTLATGTGRAEVQATGMSTALGRVAHLVATAQPGPTPLQQRLAGVSRTLLYICLGLVLAVAVLGLVHRQPALVVLMAAVSLAVAAVPEGLPAVVTIALAIGVQRMAARNVLVRQLPAVETLGCATVICTDKTGTLTTGEMAVREIWGPDHQRVIDAAAACCDAELAPDGRGGTGDPTELAILMAAAARGTGKAQIERDNPRVAVRPFDSQTRWMAILRRDGLRYVKGAVEALAGLAGGDTREATAAAHDMAGRGLRVLAVGVARGEEAPAVIGLVGIADPPRSEAIDAVATAQRAGIRTVMITGDHPATALAIGRELGLLAGGAAPADVIHARATPEDKLRIVRAWKERGAVVAMTGDGVNDAPALKESHIGIAMGKTGTEAAREAAQMVLADDNYASIVAAVREGRGVFENIRKALVYLMAGNAGELGVMLAAAAWGLPLPLVPLQLLWVNLVTDGLPALALVMDPADPDILTRPPRPPAEPMLGRPEWQTILAIGLLHTVITLAVFGWALRARDVEEARSLAFSTLVFGQIFTSLALRHRRKLIWEIGAFTNLRLVAVVAVSAVLQLALGQLPATRTLFHMGDLPAVEILLPLLVGLIPVTMIELTKLLRR
jgi:Ca2+-transporting ATPase